MPKLPVVPGNRVVKAFSKAGWTAVRQKGSHVIMVKENSLVTLSVPVHKNRPVKRGTLRDLIRDAGLSWSSSASCYKKAKEKNAQACRLSPLISSLYQRW